jgi:putative protein-disulfide isomerase
MAIDSSYPSDRGAVLHYIYDPLCGWCYGAEPLVWAAAGVPGLDLEMHAGGLWPEPTRLPDSTRRYIKEADARVGQMSGQPYGEPHFAGLLFDPELVLDSRPTTAAVLAAQALDPAGGLAMLRAIQHAHYEHGKHVVRRDVLVDAAAGIGLDRSAFEAELDRAQADAHIARSRQLMARVGAQGFPTFVLQIGDDLHGVPHHRFASDPTAFARWLAAEAQSRARAR